MQAIILHEPGQQLSALQKNFNYENIQLSTVPYDPKKTIDLHTVEAVLLHCTSEDSYVLEALNHLRLRRQILTLIVIDEVGNPEIQNKAFALGADAYYPRPLNVRKIALDLKNIVAQKEAHVQDKWIRAYDIWLNLEHRSVKRKNKIIKLRNKEFSLLEFLMLNRGKLLTRSSILENVWDRNAHFASNTVDVHINRLRKKIDDPFHMKLIHTVHCMGYIFDNKRL